MKDEELELVLEALENVTKDYVEGRQYKHNKAITVIKEALAQPAPTQEPVSIVDLKFMRQVLSVSIAGLYEYYKDDVLRVFTLDDLQTVVDLSEPLRPQQVEDIYKRAWEMLATPPAAQRTWVGLTDEEKQEWITAMPWPPQPGHLMVLIEGVESELKEKNFD